MIIIVEDDIFAPGRAEAFELVELLGLGYRGWHQIQIDPPWDRRAPLAVNRWLRQQSPALRDHSELALEAGLEAAARAERSGRSLRICTDPEPSWKADPPRLSLEGALRILKRPLQLMVEDELNDGDFLCTVTPEHWRGELKKALDAGQVEIVHGGGLPRMKPRLESYPPERRFRLWVLFDSDAESPAEASEASKELCDFCRNHGIACHQLQRRAVENYLPLPALAAWAQVGERDGRKGETLPSNVRKNRKKAYLSFKEMDAIQRHHYPMRSGFRRYLKKGKPVPKFYGDFAQRTELHGGFPGVRELFRQEHFRFHEEWLRRDGQQNETLRMARSIFHAL